MSSETSARVYNYILTLTMHKEELSTTLSEADTESPPTTITAAATEGSVTNATQDPTPANEAVRPEEGGPSSATASVRTTAVAPIDADPEDSDVAPSSRVF